MHISSNSSRPLPATDSALAVDNGVNVEGGRHMVAERIETVEGVAAARDEAATALLDVARRTKLVIFELKEPFGVVERLLSPGRDDRLYAWEVSPSAYGATG